MENDNMKDVYDLLDKFTEISKKLAFKHPYLVIIAMHEYFRNIWPNDPIIEEKLADDKLESIILCLNKYFAFEHKKSLPGYVYICIH